MNLYMYYIDDYLFVKVLNRWQALRPGLSQNVTFHTAQLGIVEKSYKNG